MARVFNHSWLALVLAAGFGSALAAPQALPKLGFGLRELQEFHAADRSRPLRERLPQFDRAGLVVLDAQDRVRVKVTLDGTQPAAAVRAQAERLGARVLAVDERYRRGVFSASVPVDALAGLSQAAGVRSVVLAPPPRTNVGLTTSQGAGVLRTDQVNATGITGAGITVGILSDSYDTSTNTVKAANDIASGDLPGSGNPLGNTQPVVVLVDQPDGIDEGRAMAQIVHDLAPGAKLCFATAFSTEVDFANNIRALADKSGACKADVVVDDIIYLAEPFFSDGVVAQAVDDVAAAGVSYFSSAGNRSGTQGYVSDFRPVSRAEAAGRRQVDLSLIPEAVSSGGFHNFSATPGVVDVSQTIELGASSNTLIFQWNDPFDAGGITADYDVYLYSSNGRRIVASSVDDNFGTDQPLEGFQVPAGTYQLVLVRNGNEPAVPLAQKIRYVIFGTVVTGEYLDPNTPITYGHNSARGANGTAAVPWFQPYQPEGFTSPGPSTFYFDREGNRLPTPEVRQKPDFAAIDGVNTTFFIGDTPEDADTLPNFFGTSAAAPHAAAVAALMLQKAGGPGSLTPAQVKGKLQATASPHVLIPNVVDATATVGGVTVTVTATGNGDTASSFNPNAFKIAMTGSNAFTLQSVTIDLTTANAPRVRLGVPSPGMLFDSRDVTTGFPITLGAVSGIPRNGIVFTPDATTRAQFPSLTVSFPGGFRTRSSVSFGIDRDETASGGGGNAAMLLIGGTVSGTVADRNGNVLPFSTTFQPRAFGSGYSTLDGYGLIDAVNAVNAATR